MKGLLFPAKTATPAQAETSTISARGENGLWDDDERDKSSRARRELSVIEETGSTPLKEERSAHEATDDVEGFDELESQDEGDESGEVDGSSSPQVSRNRQASDGTGEGSKRGGSPVSEGDVKVNRSDEVDNDDFASAITITT
jgi:hypothetical protein